MNHFDEQLKQRARREPFHTPERFQRRVRETCAGLEEKSAPVGRRERRRGRWRAWSAAAVVALFVAAPNVSPAAAGALEQVPVLGGLVRVVTLRSYFYDDGHSSAQVSLPQVTGAESAGEDVNQAIQQNIQTLLDQFYADVDPIAQGGGHQGLSVSYHVITDNEHWFTLRINAVRTQGSSSEIVRCYHINKDTGQAATLSALFPEDSGYEAVLSQQVKNWLEGQDAGEFAGEFSAIDREQSFYWGEDGSLVLVFDEGSILPASYGNPEVAVSPEVVRQLMEGT